MCSARHKMSSLISLTKGSPEPSPTKPGQLRIYDHRFCPYTYRVRLVLAAKKIPHESVYIHIPNKPEWFLLKSPSGKIPIIEKDGSILNESVIISEYLDETYPSGVKLIPTDPLEKAKGRILVENAAQLNVNLMAAFKTPGPSAADALDKDLRYYEKEFAARGTAYFNGQEPGMTDYMLWPSFEWLSIVPEWHEDIGIKLDNYPQICKWIATMKAHQVVQGIALNLSLWIEYYKGYIEGIAKPDLGL